TGTRYECAGFARALSPRSGVAPLEQERSSCSKDLRETLITVLVRMVAFVRPLLAHPAGTLRIFERVVEREQWYLFLARDRGDQLVEPADLGLGVRPAVGPRPAH